MNKRFWLISGLLAMALLLLWTLTPPQKTGTGAKEKVWRGWPGFAAAPPLFKFEANLSFIRRVKFELYPAGQI